MDPSVRRAKRALDVVASLVGLALLVPLLPLVVLALRLESRGPAFDRRRRVGVQRRGDIQKGSGGRRLHDVRGQLFTCVRFRVLGDEARVGRRSRGENPRLTCVGGLLRRTGLEHLPQMWNVLHGHMSLVGPRPSSPEFVELLHSACPSYVERLTHVKPGVFGIPRLAGADESDECAELCERMIFDLHYASRLSASSPWQVLWLDLSVVGASLARSLLEGRAIGNDVIRLDYPRHFVHLPLDTLQLSRVAPPGVGWEVTESERTITAWWYPPRRRGLALPPPKDSLVAELCDELRSEGDEAIFVRSLKPVATKGCDIVRIQVSSGLNEVHRVVAHLVRLWQALTTRTDEVAFVDRMTFLTASALATVAGGVGGEGHRLGLSVEIDDREVRLAVEVVHDDTRPAPLESLSQQLASVFRAAPNARAGA